MSPNKKFRRSPQPSPPDLRAEMPAPPPSTSPRYRPALLAAVCGALVIATLFAYRQSLSSGFITLDDPLYVTANARVQEGLDAGSIGWAWTALEASNWHPLTWLSHMLDVQLFGLDAGKHHLTSVLLHCANAVLLLLLLFRMTGALWRSAFVAALFALHPLHVESVAWIAERKDVLSTLFWLLTVFAWLSWVKSRKAGPYVLALALYALGLMAKPMLVTLPFTLLLLDFWPLERVALPLRGQGETVKRLLWEKGPLFAMATASCVITMIAQRSGGAVRSLTQIPLDERAANAGLAYGAYLFKALWPASLSVFYPHAHSGALTAASVAAVLALAAFTLLAFALRRRAPYLLFGWLWYLGTLVPVIGLVQVGDQSMADRYTYVPLIGIFISAAWGLAGLARESRARRRAAALAAAGMLAALFAATSVQAGYWVNAETLFGQALKVTSDNWLAHNCLGLAIAFSGDRRMAEAIPHFTEALRLNPRHSDIYNNLAMALKATGRLEEAVEQYRKALQLKPGAPIPRRNLVATLLRLDRIPEALDCLREARLPASGGAAERTELGMPLLQAGLDLAGRKDYPRAVLLFEQAAALVSPMPPEGSVQWGNALLQLGRYGEAADRFRGALALDPENGEAHFGLGYALSQSQRPAEAIPHYRAAYGKTGVRSGSLIWIGDIYRSNDLCAEAVQVYEIIPPGDPAYRAAVAGIAACAGKP